MLDVFADGNGEEFEDDFDLLNLGIEGDLNTENNHDDDDEDDDEGFFPVSNKTDIITKKKKDVISNESQIRGETKSRKIKPKRISIRSSRSEF